MVLTQLSRLEIENPLLLKVSIPLWFSRNTCLRGQHRYSQKMFPYHYGSHATLVETAQDPHLQERFHTTMVLTQRETVVVLYSTPIVVSIPLWFSRNVRYDEEKIILNTGFPYHYGSHATWNKASLQNRAVTCFHTTMVLTQQIVME